MPRTDSRHSVRGDLITDGTYLVRVSGSLGEPAAGRLDEVLSDVLAEEPSEVVVDATEATHAHGAALEVLRRAGRRAAAGGGVVTVACTDGGLLQALERAVGDAELAFAEGVGEAFAGVATRRYDQAAA